MNIQHYKNIILASTDISNGSWDERFTNKNIVQKNREKGCRELGIGMESLCLVYQTHSDNIAIVTKKDVPPVGEKIMNEKNGFDGIITNEKDIFLTIRTADCVPVFFWDEKKEVVGAAHCGWKGVFNELAVNMVQTFQEQFVCHLEDINVSMGPSIRSCCYKVESAPDKRLKLFEKKFGREVIRENEYLDLQKSLLIQLTRNGVPENNIAFSEQCTCCSNDYFSYYRDKEDLVGEMGHIIGMKE